MEQTRGDTDIPLNNTDIPLGTDTEPAPRGILPLACTQSPFVKLSTEDQQHGRRAAVPADSAELPRCEQREHQTQHRVGVVTVSAKLRSPL